MYCQEVIEDDFVLVSNDKPSISDYIASSNVSKEPSYLNSIATTIDKLSPILRPINLSIHDKPELGFREYHAHKVLTTFLSAQKGWVVTPHAYGIETAFIAVYDSGRKGHCVSFNVEYGESRYG
jgi:hypothetical protein